MANIGAVAKASATGNWSRKSSSYTSANEWAVRVNERVDDPMAQYTTHQFPFIFQVKSAVGGGGSSGNSGEKKSQMVFYVRRGLSEACPGPSEAGTGLSEPSSDL